MGWVDLFLEVTQLVLTAATVVAAFSVAGGVAEISRAASAAGSVSMWKVKSGPFHFDVTRG